MWIGLLWILGCYGISVAVLHICLGTYLQKTKKAAKILLITKNNQAQIEWYIRSMFFFSRLRGRDLTVTILDEGSTDDTGKIIERLCYIHRMDLEWCSPEQSLDDLLRAHLDDPVILVNLSNKEEMTRIPVFDR
jgi:hypothetical protein